MSDETMKDDVMTRVWSVHNSLLTIYKSLITNHNTPASITNNL